MEKFLNESMFTVDLGDVNTAPEIIFELSSLLDSDDIRNKRICLKLGKVDLNQSQLLSIKSLINGIDSTLSSIETKSVETEKVAISLGIIVSNVSAENTTEVIPAMPYKSLDELKEEIKADIEEKTANESFDIVEEEVKEEIKEEAIQEQQPQMIENNINEFSMYEQNIQQKIEEPSVVNADIAEELIVEQKTEPLYQTTIPAKEDVQDELDVIFGSNPTQNAFYEMAEPEEEQYASKEELADIIVPEVEYTKEDLELESFPTKYIKQTIRSGQVINYEGNIVIIGDCHPGCEITAFGDITIWGVLSGIAHAGSAGNQKARVRALKMNAIQLRIANCYSRRPDSLNTVYIEKTNSFTPEEARIINGEIVVFKIND